MKEAPISEVLEVEYVDVTSKLLEMNEENSFINKRNLKNFAGSEDFKVKLTSPYGSSGYLNINIDRGNLSSEDEEPQDSPLSNPFDKVVEGVLFRRVIIKNLSSDSILMVANLRTAVP